VPEQACCSEEKQTPPTPPQICIGAIDLSQDCVDRSSVRVEIVKPIQGGPLVVSAAPAPIVLGREKLWKAHEQPMARHDAAGEEMLRNPVGSSP
jgi:hypothetical protein